MPTRSPLADHLMRQAVLRLLCEARSKSKIAIALGINRKTIQRYVVNHPRFGEAVARAVEIGSVGAADPAIVEELLAGEQPSDLPPSPPPPPRKRLPELPPPVSPAELIEAPGDPTADPADLLEEIQKPPVVAVLAEVVDSAPSGDAGSLDPFDGLPDFNERALLALSWRLVNDPKTSAAVHATHARCLHNHFKTRARRQTLMQLSSMPARQSAPTERGLTRLAVMRFRRAVIGPDPGPPPGKEDEDVA